MNKKAISDIVSTVLIIMISVAAVGIIGALVVPMVKDSLTGGTACFNALSDVSIDSESGFTCINRNGSKSEVRVVIKKGSDATVVLGAIDIIIEDEKGNRKVHRTDDSEEMPGLNEAKVLTVKGIGANSTNVYFAPVLQIGNRLRECESTGKTVLVDCM